MAGRSWQSDTVRLVAPPAQCVAPSARKATSAETSVMALQSTHIVKYSSSRQASPCLTLLALILVCCSSSTHVRSKTRCEHQGTRIGMH